jgi:hypothetical protein
MEGQMTNSDYLLNLNTEQSISYADSYGRFQTQLPLLFSYPTQSGSLNPNDLYSDNSEQYLAYPAGVHQTTVTTSQLDRYGSITLTTSGSISFYVQSMEYAGDSNPAYIAGPYIVSGEGGLDDLFIATYYDDTPQNPFANSFSITTPGTYSVVFPSPLVSRAFTITHSGSSTYSISQILPRKIIQKYDIEVNSIKAYHVSSTLIDTIALQVSDSIVVGSGLIGEKSIDGGKIIDGTISGVLIANGTVTGNNVQAGTISGVLIAGSTITGDKIVAATISGSLITAGTLTADKIASNTLTAAQIADGTITGAKIVAGTVSGVLITDNAISASKIQANTITGDKIAANTISGSLITAATISGSLIAANTITADKLSVAQLDAVAANMGTLTVNSDITVSGSGYIKAGKTKIDTNGMSVGSLASPLNQTSLPGLNSNVLTIVTSGTSGDLQGIAMFNVAQSTVSPQASINLDGTTTLEIANNVTSNDASIHVNFKDSYTGAFRIYNGNLDLRRTPDAVSNLPPGAIRGYADSIPDAVIYELSQDRINLSSYTGTTIYNVEASTGAVTITGDVAVNTNKVSIVASNGNTDIRGNVTVSGSISHRDAGILSRSAGQTVNAGTSARVQLNVAGTGNILGNATTYEVTVTNAGLYIVNAAVTSTTTNLPWNVRQNATSFTTGTQMLPGLTFNDGRQLNTTIFYLSANDTVGLFVNNTGGSSISVTGALRVVRLT